MAEYAIQGDENPNAAQEAREPQTLPPGAVPETIDYLHPPDGEFADSLSDRSSGLSVSSIVPSDECRKDTERRLRRRHIVEKSRQRKREAIEHARQEIKKYREQQAGWEELQEYTKTWLGVAHWLLKQHEPVTLYLNTDRDPSEATLSPAEILFQTRSETGMSLQSEVVADVTLSSDDLLTAWLPSESHEAGTSSEKPRKKIGRPRIEWSTAEDEGMTKAELKRRANTRYYDRYTAKKATKESEVRAELASFQSQLPTIRACEQFVEVWRRSFESMFDDFQGGLTSLQIQSMSEINEGTLPLPSGITVEVPGKGSRFLSRNWAGEWLGSPPAEHITGTGLAMADSGDSSNADMNDNGSGTSLTSTRSPRFKQSYAGKRWWRVQSWIRNTKVTNSV